MGQVRERKGKNKKHFLKNKKLFFILIFYFFVKGLGFGLEGVFCVGSVGWFGVFEGFESVGMVQDLREWESVEGFEGLGCGV